LFSLLFYLLSLASIGNEEMWLGVCGISAVEPSGSSTGMLLKLSSIILFETLQHLSKHLGITVSRDSWVFHRQICIQHS